MYVTYIRKLKNNYKKYKHICNRIWNKRCTFHDNKEELKDSIKFAQKCKDQRLEFQDKCCDKEWDIGHQGAVLKMDNIIHYCQSTLDELLAEKAEGWVVVKKR